MYLSIYSSVTKLIVIAFLSSLLTITSNAQEGGQLKQQIQQALKEEGLTGA
jgi:hypothetical protein